MRRTLFLAVWLLIPGMALAQPSDPPAEKPQAKPDAKPENPSCVP